MRLAGPPGPDVPGKPIICPGEAHSKGTRHPHPARTPSTGPNPSPAPRRDPGTPARARHPARIRTTAPTPDPSPAQPQIRSANSVIHSPWTAKPQASKQIARAPARNSQVACTISTARTRHSTSVTRQYPQLVNSGLFHTGPTHTGPTHTGLIHTGLIHRRSWRIPTIHRAAEGGCQCQTCLA
jgi:hypothetical protein